MNIGLDLDEVLADTIKSLLQWHNEIYETNFQRGAVTSYNLWKTWGGNREEAINKVYDFYQSAHFKKIQPVKDSQEGVKKLQLKNRIYVVTSRPHDIYNETLSWISEHFPNQFVEVKLTNQWAKKGKGKNKKDLCKELGIEVIVEDSLEYAQECSQSGIRVLLLDCPWNKSKEIDRVKRVFSWREIIEELRIY